MMEHACRTRLFRGFAILQLAAVLVFLTGTAARASGSGLKPIKALSLNVSDRFAVDGARHRLLAIHGDPTLNLGITSVDSITLKESKPVEFPAYVNQGLVNGKPTVFAFDPKRRLLYLVAYHSHQEQIGAVNPLLLSIDVDHWSVSEKALSAIFPPGFRTLGMTLDSGTGNLVLTGQVQPEAVFATIPRVAAPLVVEIDPASSAAGVAGPLGTPQPLRGCEALISNQSQNSVGIHDHTLFVACATSSVSAATMPGVPAVVAMPMSSPASATISFLPGSYTLGDVMVDPIGHRLLLVGSAPERPAQAVWVFDMPKRVFLGQVAAGDLNLLSAGINPANGRLYVGISASSGSALLVGSDRGLEIPQAVTAPAHPIVGVIQPIPGRSAVIVPSHRPEGPFYEVYADDVSAAAIEPGQPIDYSIVDKELSDQPQFAGDVQAFGVRVHQMGGVNGLGQNVLARQEINYWSAIPGSPVSPASISKLRDGDRDFAFGRIGVAHLSEADASAASAESKADDNTDHDYNQLRSSKLSSTEANCVDFGSAPKSDAASNASVSCSQTLGIVKANASSTQLTVAQPGSAAALVKIGASESTATLTRVGHGVSSFSHAEVRDLELGGGIVRIGYVSSDATSLASGVKGKAKAAYAVVFDDVHTPTYSCGSSLPGVVAHSGACNAAAVVRAISDALGSQVRVEMPGVDVSSTMGGGHAHAVRNLWEHQQDVVVNNQPVTETQVAALRLTFVGDNAAASRLIVELAATDASSTSVPLGTLSLRDPKDPLPVHVPTHVLGDKQVTPHVDPGHVNKPSPLPPQILSTITSIAGHGWKVLFPGTAAGMVRVALVWALLLMPAVMKARRRELGRVRDLKP